MRTQEEIVNRIDKVIPNDPLGFEWQEYLPYLDFEHAKKYLNGQVTEEEWSSISSSNPLDLIKDYMPFALEKAHGERGISANRSIQHMLAWLWLAEENELFNYVQDQWDNNYHDYGLPILYEICNRLNLDIPAV